MDYLNHACETVVHFFANLSILEIIALLFLGYYLIYLPLYYEITWWIHHCSGASKRVLRPRGQDDYAIITGGTDGIGLEFSRQLAELGFNLLLLSRTEEKLVRVAETIQEQFPQCKKIDHLAVDFTRTDIYDQIQSKVHTLPGRVHVLVNNIGIFYETPDYFTEYPIGFNAKVVAVNVMSVTQMTEIVLKKMIAQIEAGGKQKKCSGPLGSNGIVINVSSFLGTTEFPGFSSYGASKAYMNYLGKCLAEECKPNGIFIQTVYTNQVKTSSNSGADPLMAVNADEYVRAVLLTVGVEPQTNGHRKHKRINNLLGLVKGLLGDALFMRVKVAMVNNVRQRALKDARKASLGKKLEKVVPVQ